MRTPHRRLAVAAAVALLVAAAGCGGDDKSKGAETGAKLTMYAFSSSPAEDAILRKVVDDYNKQGRNTVQVKILPEYDTALTTALAGGEPPDVFYVNDNKLPDLAKNGVLEAVGDKVDNPADFYDTLKKSFTYKGTYYCPPKDFSTLQLVYNTDDFAAAGVKPPSTWDELTATAKALTKPGRPGLVMGPALGLSTLGRGGAGGLSYDYPVMLTGSVLTIIPVAIVFIVFQRFFVRGVAASGVKG